MGKAKKKRDRKKTAWNIQHVYHCHMWHKPIIINPRVNRKSRRGQMNDKKSQTGWIDNGIKMKWTHENSGRMVLSRPKRKMMNQTPLGKDHDFEHHWRTSNINKNDYIEWGLIWMLFPLRCKKHSILASKLTK